MATGGARRGGGGGGAGARSRGAARCGAVRCGRLRAPPRRAGGCGTASSRPRPLRRRLYGNAAPAPGVGESL